MRVAGLARLDRIDLADGTRRYQQHVGARLEPLLEALLSSPSYSLKPGSDQLPTTRGVYLFVEEGRPMYVGRTGRTERAVLADRHGYSNFRTRLKSHVLARHNAGTFAYRMACHAFREHGRELGSSRESNCQNSDFMTEFKAQCERAEQMEIKLVEIDEPAVAAAFEIYAAIVLDTPFNVFYTS